jgi:glycosyltransferase involved in cell wall biosynthesis
MSDTPNISVVMSVYNGAPHLRETIDSVLSQEGVTLEFIIVNDGSTDTSPEILENYSRRDSRVTIIHQSNQGLTKALIRGCAEASGPYIARQDAGDISLPGRFSKQLAIITEGPDCALVSCGTRFVGPECEHLYDVTPDPSDATQRLLVLDLADVRGPSIHGCTLFPKALYDQVGGYRPEIYFAQDLDLWLRLAERGNHIVLPEILYQASVRVASISGIYRKEQVETAGIVLECARRRRNALSETPALDRAQRIRPSGRKHGNRISRARTLYFIGVCLRNRSNPQAQSYFRRALLTYPLHLKSAARLLFG